MTNKKDAEKQKILEEVLDKYAQRRTFDSWKHLRDVIDRNYPNIEGQKKFNDDMEFLAEIAFAKGYEKGITEEAIGCHDHCKAEVKKAVKDTEKRMIEELENHIKLLPDDVKITTTCRNGNLVLGWKNNPCQGAIEQTRRETLKKVFGELDNVILLVFKGKTYTKIKEKYLGTLNPKDSTVEKPKGFSDTSETKPTAKKEVKP